MLINPSVVPTARANQAFLAWAVRYLTGEAGLRQFLDIGTGMSASSNIHEVAQLVAPQARVVYVDHDPIVLCHARAPPISAPEGRTNFIEADLRQPLAILSEAARTLDFGRPGRDHPDRDLAPDPGRRGALSARPPAGRCAGAGQLPGDQPRGCGHRQRRHGEHDQPPERADGAADDTAQSVRR